MSDDIQALTAQLATDPSSLVFLELAEALRHRRQLDAAVKVARAGLARYPDLTDAHDLLGRILADRGEAASAAEAWGAALALDPGHVGANKGMAFLLYHHGDVAGALDYLQTAARAAPDDAGLHSAISRVRAELPRYEGIEVTTAPTNGGGSASGSHAAPLEIEAAAELIAASIAEQPAPDREPSVSRVAEAVPVAPVASPDGREESMFAGFEGADDGMLLLDRNGMRLGGGLRSPDGEDVGDTVAAHLSGVSREAERAARLLGLGALESVAAESPDGNLYLLTPSEDTVLLTVRDRSVPVGRLALVAERAAKAARIWLERLT